MFSKYFYATTPPRTPITLSQITKLCVRFLVFFFFRCGWIIILFCFFVLAASAFPRLVFDWCGIVIFASIFDNFQLSSGVGHFFNSSVQSLLLMLLC